MAFPDSLFYGSLRTINSEELAPATQADAAWTSFITKGLRLASGDTLVVWPNANYSRFVHSAVMSCPHDVNIVCPDLLFPIDSELIAFSRDNADGRTKFLFDLTFSRRGIWRGRFRYEETEYPRLDYPKESAYGDYARSLLNKLGQPLQSHYYDDLDNLSYLAIAAELAKSGLAMVIVDDTSLDTSKSKQLCSDLIGNAVVQEVIEANHDTWCHRQGLMAITVSSQRRHEVVACYCRSHGDSLLVDPSHEMQTPEELRDACQTGSERPLLASADELLKLDQGFSPSAFELISLAKGYKWHLGDIAYRPKLIRTTRLRARESKPGLSKAKLFTNAAAGTSPATLNRLQDVYVDAAYEDEFLEPGDILISRLSSFGSAPTISLIPDNLPCRLVTTPNYLVFRLNERNYVMAELLYLYLNSAHAQKVLGLIGGRTRKSLLWDQIGSIEISPEVMEPPTKDKLDALADLFARRDKREEEYIQAVRALRQVDLEVNRAFDGIIATDES